VNPEPALFRRVDEEEPAERPEGLTAQPGLRFLLEEDDAATAVGQFRGRDQAGEPGTDHDHISAVCHQFLIVGPGKTLIESRGWWRRCVDMAEVITDDLVIRAYWPLQQSGESRTSYSIPCFAVAFGFLCVALVYTLSGSPLDTLLGRRFSAVDLFALALGLFAVASILAYWFDGTVLIANHDRIVLRKWFRQPRVLAIRDLSRIVLCSIDSEWLRAPYNWVPAIFFFNRDGRCVMSLYSRFRGEDLAQLWAMIAIKPEGSWSDRLPTTDLNRRFPGAF
jgi:hypothetical protein